MAALVAFVESARSFQIRFQRDARVMRLDDNNSGARTLTPNFHYRRHHA
jgi:hypothetical protein